MIGNPTNFVHTGHIGSADVELSANRLNAISTQMQSKGGYETNSIHSLHVSQLMNVDKLGDDEGEGEGERQGVQSE